VSTFQDLLRSSAWRETRATLTLAVPIVIGQVSQMLMGLTDTFMIGQVGTVPLAASAFAGNLFGVFYVVGIGLLLPLSVLVARERGAGNAASCGRMLRSGLWMALGFGVAETAIMGGLAFSLHRFGQPAEVVAEARTYYLLITASLLPALVFQVFRQFSESLGRPRLPMMVMLGGVVLNVGLNALLIYGHWGLPALGLAGAGWATLASRILALAVLVGWLARDSHTRPYWPDRWSPGGLRAQHREVVRLGVPGAGQLLFESGAFTAASLMMGWLGAVALAAHQIAISCAATTFMFLLGLSIAVSIRVGEAVGAGQRDRLRAIGFGALGLGTLVMSGFALSLFVAARPLAGLFVDDPAVVETAARLLVIAAIFQIFDGGQVVGAGALRGLTDVRVPTAITFVAYWLIALPLGYIWGVRGGGGPEGIWAALALGLAAAALLLAGRFARLTRIETSPAALQRGA
jgi:multidrug resistance protein, MATE family